MNLANSTPPRPHQCHPAVHGGLLGPPPTTSAGMLTTPNFATLLCKSGRQGGCCCCCWVGGRPPLSRSGTIFIVISQNSLGFVRKLACGSRRGSLLFQPADVVTPSAQPLIGLGDRRSGAACGGCHFDMCATEWATYSRQVFCCISAVQEGRSLPKQR